MGDVCSIPPINKLCSQCRGRGSPPFNAFPTENLIIIIILLFLTQIYCVYSEIMVICADRQRGLQHIQIVEQCSGKQCAVGMCAIAQLCIVQAQTENTREHRGAIVQWKRTCRCKRTIEENSQMQ